MLTNCYSSIQYWPKFWDEKGSSSHKKKPQQNKSYFKYARLLIMSWFHYKLSFFLVEILFSKKSWTDTTSPKSKNRSVPGYDKMLSLVVHMGMRRAYIEKKIILRAKTIFSTENIHTYMYCNIKLLIWSKIKVHKNNVLTIWNFV